MSGNSETRAQSASQDASSLNQTKRTDVGGPSVQMYCTQADISVLQEEKSESSNDCVSLTSQKCITEQSIPQQATPEENRSEQTTLEQAIPEENTPVQATPEENRSEQTTREQANPEENRSEQTTLEQATPEENTPMQATPEENRSEQTTLEQATPEENIPMQATPEENRSEQTTPEDNAPVLATLEQDTPEENIREENTPMQASPEKNTQEKNNKEENTPEKNNSDHTLKSPAKFNLMDLLTEGSADTTSSTQTTGSRKRLHPDEDMCMDAPMFDASKPKRPRVLAKQGYHSGTTAVVGILRENDFVVANAGDSKCVLASKGMVVGIEYKLLGYHGTGGFIYKFYNYSCHLSANLA